MVSVDCAKVQQPPNQSLQRTFDPSPQTPPELKRYLALTLVQTTIRFVLMRHVLPLLLIACLIGATDVRAQSERSSTATADTSDAVALWLASNAVRLETVEAGSGFDDLQGLLDVVGDARIVLLGEPTHGNREVYQLKHRMVEFLVEEMGFNVFAFETPMPESFDVDAYVSGGVGTPERALAAAHMWAGDTESVAEMLAWMRRHNATSTQSLTFYGFDMQSPERATAGTLAYLERVDPGLAAIAREAFGHLAISFSDPEAVGYRPIVDRDSDAAVQIGIADVLARFDANERNWTEATNADDWAVARQHAQVLQRWVEANSDGGHRYGVVRDATMAENIRWILEREGSDAKVIVWAHNTHVANWDGWSIPALGLYLREWYGSEAVIVGALFGRGGFHALEVGAASRGLWAFEVGAPPEGTIEAAFAAAGLDLAVVDLRRLPAHGPVTEWFSTPQLTRNSGGVYDASTPRRHLLPYTAPEAFDALLYVDTTTPTRPVEPADYGTFPVLATPVNLGFEHGVLGEAPPGWLVWSKLRRFGFEAVTTSERPFDGARAAVIRRDQADEIGEASGSVLQRVDASAYRGRQVRLRAAARAELADGDIAFLRLRIHAPEYVDHDPADIIFDSLDEYRVASSEWRVFEIEADVPEGAGMISYGLFLVGSGAVWLDAVSFEVMDQPVAAELIR